MAADNISWTIPSLRWAYIFFSNLQLVTKVENSWNDTSFPGGNIEKAGSTCTVSTGGGVCVVFGGNVGLKHSVK